MTSPFMYMEGKLSPVRLSPVMELVLKSRRLHGIVFFSSALCSSFASLPFVTLA